MKTFEQEVSCIREQDKMNAMDLAFPGAVCKKGECEKRAASAFQIATMCNIDPRLFVRDMVANRFALEYGCKKQNKETSLSDKPYTHYGAKIPGCRFGYTYGSHPDATDDQLERGNINGSNNSSSTPSYNTRDKYNSKLIPGEKSSYQVKAEKVNADAVKWARKKIGSKSYAKERSNRELPSGTNKCNQFVIHAFNLPQSTLGINDKGPIVNGEKSSYGFGMKRYPSAAEIYSGCLGIDGFESVTTPQPGDIASNGHHVGIVSGNETTISASASGEVVENDWGFRKDGEEGAKSKTRFFRYTGKRLEN